MNASTVLKEWLYFVSFIVFVGYMTGCQKSVVEQTALSQQIVIQGQVFVVTKSRENIKLGGETVLLFSRDAREQSAQWCAWSNQLVEAQNKVEATLRLPAVPTPTSITLTKLQTALQIHKEKSLNSDISLTELETEGEWIIKLTAAIDDLKIKIAEECPIFKAMDERDHLFNSLN